MLCKFQMERIFLLLHLNYVSVIAGLLCHLKPVLPGDFQTALFSPVLEDTNHGCAQECALTLRLGFCFISYCELILATPFWRESRGPPVVKMPL